MHFTEESGYVQVQVFVEAFVSGDVHVEYLPQSRTYFIVVIYLIVHYLRFNIKRPNLSIDQFKSEFFSSQIDQKFFVDKDVAKNKVNKKISAKS